jgi:hypothetical protein
MWGAAHWLLCLSLTFTVPAEAYAQATGGIRGTVRDATGSVLPGTTVEAASPARIGGAATTVTNDQGVYVIENLPVGIYSVTFTLTGFSTVKQEGIRVEVGRSIELNQALAVSTLEETVTVSGQSPVVDAVHAGASTNFNQELLENIPTPRLRFFDTISYAPGVKFTGDAGKSSSFTMFGANQWTVKYDGIDVSSPGGGPWDWPNFETFTEVDLKAVGVSAEEWGFTGGQVNLILRSGTNQFHGSGFYFYSGGKLVANNTPNEPLPFNLNYIHDINYTFGGPIKRDRLWFQFVTQNYRWHETPIGLDPQYTKAVRSWRPFVKVNARVSNRDDITASFNSSRIWWPYGQSREKPYETTNNCMARQPTMTARWTRTMGSATLLEVSHGGQYNWGSTTPPASGDFTTPGRLDIATGLYSVNALNHTRFQRRHNSYNVTLAHTASDFLGGMQEFKFGVQVHRERSVTHRTRTGGLAFYDLGGQPYELTRSEPWAPGALIQTDGAFVQDNWRVAERVTLNLGLRFDRVLGEVPEIGQLDLELQKPTGVTFSGVPDLITWKNLAPRLGATIKLDEAGKTVAKTSWGRYHYRLHPSALDVMAPGQEYSTTYGYNRATAQYDIVKRTTVPAFRNEIDPDLTSEYWDQWHVGVERELMPNFGINLMFLRKTRRDALGTMDITGVYAPQPYVDTFQGRTQTITVFNRITPAAASRLRYTNRDLGQDYKTVVIEANKRMSRGWQLLGSYQWQRDRIQTEGSDPNDLINSYGRAARDNTHGLRFSTTVFLPYDVTLGARYFFDTGAPYARVVTVRGLGQGPRTVIAEPIGAYEFPNFHNVAIQTAKRFPLSGSQTLRLSFDLFNLLNSDAATLVRNNSTQATFPFGTLYRTVEPRRGQVGIRYEF